MRDETGDGRYDREAGNQMHTHRRDGLKLSG